MDIISIFGGLSDYGIVGFFILFLIVLAWQLRAAIREINVVNKENTDKYIVQLQNMIESEQLVCNERIKEHKELFQSQIDDLKTQVRDTKEDTKKWKDEDKGKVFEYLIKSDKVNAKQMDQLIELTRAIHTLSNKLQ